ncbi:MAG: B12-binding domain-containing radical SAM protein [Candidatus Omnitrophota bacterium]
MNSRVKVSLVYPPFSTPTSVPFALACLKGYLKRRDASFDVNTFDFNLDLYERFITAREDLKLSYFCRKLNLPCLGGKIYQPVSAGEFNAILLARRYFRSTGKFTDSRHYSMHLRNFYTFFIDRIRVLYNRILENFLVDRRNNRLMLSFFKDEIARINSCNPDIIGISLHNLVAETFSFYPFALAKALKISSKAPIVMGGSAFSHVEAGDFLREFDSIDYIIKGPGAESLYLLARNLKRNRIKAIPNLIYRQGGRIIRNKEAAGGIGEFSYPDFSGFKLKKYYNPKLILPVMFSKGCSWGACVFCKYYGDHKGKPLFKDPDEFAKELEFLQKKYAAKYFLIVDNCIPQAKLLRLSRAILSRGLKLNYSIYARPSRKFTPCVLRSLSSSGCKLIHWGVEAASSRILNLMNKGTKIEEVERLLKNSKAARIKNLIYMIFDFPLQNKEEYRKNLEFLRRMQPYVSFIGLHFFRLQEGTVMSRNPLKYNIRIESRQPLFSLGAKKINSSVYHISPLKEIVDPVSYQAEKLLFISYVKKFSMNGYFEEHMFFQEHKHKKG